MLCQRCDSRVALMRDGVPVRVSLFGTIEGCFCAECIVALQQPYEEALRAEISARAPALTDDDLSAVPDQMLKFTLCLPIPHQR